MRWHYINVTKCSKKKSPKAIDDFFPLVLSVKAKMKDKNVTLFASYSDVKTLAYLRWALVARTQH